MRLASILILIICLTTASGCQISCFGKRNTEFKSPTDIRQSHPWCLGEDAIFEYPCGPSREDYGLKPTCWREWPAGGARCNENCYGPPTEPTIPFDAGQQPLEEWVQPGTPDIQNSENPFRDDAEPLPAPGGQGARMRRPVETVRPQIERPMPAMPRAGFASAVPNSTDSRRAISVPVVLPATPHDQQYAQPAVNMIVSGPMDTPSQSFAQAPPPQNIAGPSFTASSGYNFRGYDASPQTAAPYSVARTNGRPATVHNGHAVSKPFRLATRNSQAKAIVDPALEGETLSALETLMSDDARPSAVR